MNPPSAKGRTPCTGCAPGVLPRPVWPQSHTSEAVCKVCWYWGRKHCKAGLLSSWKPSKFLSGGISMIEATWHFLMRNLFCSEIPSQLQSQRMNAVTTENYSGHETRVTLPNIWHPDLSLVSDSHLRNLCNKRWQAHYSTYFRREEGHVFLYQCWKEPKAFAQTTYQSCNSQTHIPLTMPTVTSLLETR